MSSLGGSVDDGFSGTKAAEIVGITYRQLDYWARTDLIRPAVTDARGSGSRRAYSYRNLLELRIVKQLLDAGIKLEVVRDVFANLRAQVGEDISSANIVIDGKSALLARDDGELIDLVRQGQGVLNVLSLGRVAEEVQASVSQLRAPADEAGAAGGVAAAQ